MFSPSPIHRIRSSSPKVHRDVGGAGDAERTGASQGDATAKKLLIEDADGDETQDMSTEFDDDLKKGVSTCKILNA